MGLVDPDHNRVEDTDAGGSNTAAIEVVRPDYNRIRRNITDSESETVVLLSEPPRAVRPSVGGRALRVGGRPTTR